MPAKMADQDRETLEETLSGYTQGVAMERIDPDTLHFLKRDMLDFNEHDREAGRLANLVLILQIVVLYAPVRASTRRR